MAASGYKKNKPELVAIYRLEFYKNKKKWKFCNEKTSEIKVPPQETTETQRHLALDKTYSVDQNSDNEATDKEKTSPLNNAFIHEIPYDTPYPELPEPRPPPPTPQSTEGIWSEDTSEHGSQPSQKDVWMKHEVNSQQPIKNTQRTLSTDFCQQLQQWTNHPSSHHSHEAWTNQGQPIDLQWLMKTSDNIQDGWQPQSPGPSNQGVWNDKSLTHLLKAQDNESSIINTPEIQPTWPNNPTPNQFYPTLWTNTPPPASPLQNIQNKDPLSNLPKTQDQNTWNQMSGQSGKLPQGPLANSLQMLLCPDKWKKQSINTQKCLDPPNINPDDFTKPPPGYKPDIPDIWAGQTDFAFLTKPPPVIPTHLRKNSGSWTDQHNNPQKVNPDTLNNQTPNSWSFTRPPLLVSAVENPQKSAENANVMSITPTSIKPNPDIWPNNQKGPAAWTNPALLVNAEQQNLWTNQAWQKQQDILGNKDQDWVITMSEDVNDGVTVDDGETVDLQPQYSNNLPIMKPQLPPGPMEESPEHIRERADRCLRRLLQVYQTDTQQDTTEHLGDETSVEFFREAHDVPHSTEKDPTEIDECICSHMPVEALAGMSAARLSALILHAATTLRDALKEQLIRDQLPEQRNRQVISLEEYPTRDTDLFGYDHVLSGSHIPRSVAELGRERVIKIDMGRPYRL